jgi:hypothetical protein
MTSSDQNVSRSRRLFPALAVGVVIWVGGYCNLFAQTDTEHNAEKALSELQIDVTATEPNIPIPEIYTTPPKIVMQMVGGVPEWKLFYFCKQHTSDDLKKIVHEQFATKLFDKKGKETKLVDYTVSSNPATNQLIVRCPTEEDANAVLELLEMVDVPPIQIKIDCLISEVYADFTFDRETTIAIENLFGEGIAMKPGGLPFATNVQELIDEGGEVLPAFPGASMRELIRARMGLNIGYLSTTHQFTALVDLLESHGYLKILMNPVLETVNGKTAMVKSSQHVPLQTITMRSTQSDYLETRTEYIDVIDSLEITPHVFADGSIGLETSILLGARNTPDGVKQVPIITKREITSKENRIRPGESLIIGGMRKTVEFGVVRGVPILKDIPLIGFLFSGEDTEQRAVETVFILTPTYSTGGRPKKEVMEEIRKKHEPASPGKLQEAIKGIFGDKSKQQKALEAERSRLDAQAEKALARNATREAEVRGKRVTAEAQKATSDAAKTKADAEKLIAEAKELMAEAEAKSKAAETAKAAADKAAADATKTKAEAEKTKADAQKTIAQADKKAKAAEAAKAAADKMTADAKKAQAEAETAKAEADAKARAAEKAKQEAEKSKEESEKAEAEKPKEESEAKAETEESKEDAEEAKAEKDNAEPEV